MPLSGLLSEYGFAGGWPSIFYVFGIVGTAWSLAFLFFVSEDPEQCPTIKEAEKKYILSSLWGAAGSSVSILGDFLLCGMITQLCAFKSGQRPVLMFRFCKCH